MVDHDILLRKLEYAGVRGEALRLLFSFVTDRSQFVNINGVSSMNESVQIGVPQGSVLGPILFLIYINDIFKLPILGELLLFADDTSIFYPAMNRKELEYRIVHDVGIMKDYMRINKLAINADKTQFLVFSTRNTSDNISFIFNNTRINEVKEVKYLGVVLSSNLKWESQLARVRKKISPGLGILYKFRRLLNSNTKRMLYSALVHSHLIFSSIIWGAAGSSLLSPLQIIQNRALKIVYNKNIRFPTEELYINVVKNILPIKGIYFLQVLTYTYKNVNKIGYNSISFNTQPHTFNTRFNSDLYVNSVRLELTKQKLSYIGPKMYNSLPVQIKTKESLLGFKSKTRDWIFEQKKDQIM